MAGDDRRTGGGGNEHRNEHRDEHEELVELLNELRVALPGVQVLFAFLLTIPFTGRYTELSTFQEMVFSVTFLFAALALAFLMAPPAYHRIRFRAGDDEAMLRISNRLTIVGLVCLAVSLDAATVLVADLVHDGTIAIVAGVVVGLLLIGLWFALPIARAMMSRS